MKKYEPATAEHDLTCDQCENEIAWGSKYYKVVDEIGVTVGAVCKDCGAA